MTVLDRCWKNCLGLWKWVSENWVPGMCIITMKKQWMQAHHFTRYRSSNCFFCQYAIDKGQEVCDSHGSCPNCPGVLVSPRFKCGNAMYSYIKSPKLFYKKLLKMDKIRQGAK